MEHLPADPSPSDGGSFAAGFLRDTAFVPDQIGGADEIAGEPGADPAQSSMTMIPPELVEQGLSGTFEVVFGLIAEKRGEHWLLKPFEKEGLSRAWAPLLGMLLARLGSTEQGMLALALMTTAAVVGGKVAQDATKWASSTASTRTRESGASSVSSASGGAARPHAPSSSYSEPDVS